MVCAQADMGMYWEGQTVNNCQLCLPSATISVPDLACAMCTIASLAGECVPVGPGRQPGGGARRCRAQVRDAVWGAVLAEYAAAN